MDALPSLTKDKVENGRTEASLQTALLPEAMADIMAQIQNIRRIE